MIRTSRRVMRIRTKIVATVLMTVLAPVFAVNPLLAEEVPTPAKTPADASAGTSAVPSQAASGPEAAVSAAAAPAAGGATALTETTTPPVTGVPTTAGAPASTGAAEAAAAEEEVAQVDPGNITVNFKGADIRTILAYISEVAGIDIVPAPDVKGIVDLKLTNKPWKVALDVTLRNYGFAYEREGDIIRVVTVDKLKQEELTTQTFTLNYAKSKEVVESIKDILSSRGKIKSDERTNIVIVTDIPTNIYKIGEVIKRLDKLTDQVLIEARIIETVLDDTEKLGIDWNIKISATGAKRPITAPFDYFGVEPDTIKKFMPAVQTNTVSYYSDPGTGEMVQIPPADFPTSGAVTQAFPFSLKTDYQFGTLDFSQFSAVLEMIKSRANTDIVSNPRIATLNNKEASIQVGQIIGMPKYERNSQTGKMEVTGYESKDLGVKMTVTPHINDVGEIVVDLKPEITDLLRYDTLDRASGVVAPVFSTRMSKTQAMIKDGDTIFIGGLIKENLIDTRKKVPILGDMLGDVPYLGLLVSKKETTKQKTELIFFITVHLLKAGKEIKDMPTADKAYVPLYTATQGEDQIKKKRIKKRF